jgi:hypothetical protein
LVRPASTHYGKTPTRIVPDYTTLPHQGKIPVFADALSPIYGIMAAKGQEHTVNGA